MRQTILSVPLEVKPESASRLAAIVEAIRAREAPPGGAAPAYDKLATSLPALHFMSMSVFPGKDYDPLFILEANFDGAPGPFWGQFEAVFGPDLRAILRCCKRPLDEDGPLYDAVTGGGAAPVAPYLEARTQRPSVFHQGNRGLTRSQILAGRALFQDATDALDAAPQPGQPSYHELPAAGVHTRLRTALLPGHPWLDQPAPLRVTSAENLADWGRLLLFGVVAVLVLCSPGLVLAAVMPTISFVMLSVLALVVFGGLLYRNRHSHPGTEVKSSFSISAALLGQAAKLAAVIVLYVALVSVVLDPLVSLASVVLHAFGAGPALGPGAVFWPTARVVALSLISLPTAVLLLLVWVRRSEMRDASQDSPPQDERILREMVRREDWIMQNHMGSIVLIKPGILRSVIIRAGHLGLGLVLRATARDGFLGSMRTVHFAHWAFLNNGSRLLFFSNFDHSWGSYLDDFIEKAHEGLTLAWGCGVGFPVTRFLVYDGASHGRQFKAWALASRTVSRFWYSAYPDLTVDQIERNERLAAGLRKPQLADAEAKLWMQDL